MVWSMSGHPSDLEQLVLLAILQVTEGAHGAAVQERLERGAGRELRIGTIYNTLLRLEERGLVTSRMGDPTPVRGGKARRLYSVTAEGLEALRVTRAIYDRMWEAASGAV